MSFTVSWSLLILMSIESVMSSNFLIFCCLLLLLASIIPSIRVFSNESVPYIRWPKYWSFSFSVSPSVNIQGWFPLGLIGLISLGWLSKGVSRIFCSTTIWKHQFFSAQPFCGPTLTSTHLLEWPKSKKVTIPNAGEDVEQKKLSFIASGNAKQYSHFGRQAISYKTKHSVTIYQSCILIFT